MDFSLLKWAVPVSVLVEDGKLWLVAGEDVRYSLSAKNAEELAAMLRRCDAPGSLCEALERATPSQRREWEEILRQLYSERVLVECSPVDLECESAAGFVVFGENTLARELRDGQSSGPDDVRLFCQDNLDYARALEFNRQALEEKFRWIWITTGPSDRAYLGPLFLPRIGPCLECLLHHFRHLSPEPELYDVLATNRPEGSFAGSSFPEEGRAVLARLSRWKLTLLGSRPANPALYSLHVLERATLATSLHHVFRNPECPACHNIR